MHRKHSARKGIGYRVTIGLLLILSMILTQGNFVKAAGTASSSSNLNEFTQSVSINAPQENGKYTVKKGSQYEISLSFAEDSEGTQFANPMTYTLPAGFNDVDQKFDTFAINVSEGSGGTYTVYGNTVSLSGGKLTVRFNESDPNWNHLQEARNTQFNLMLKGTFDDSAKTLDWGNGQKTSLNVDTNGTLTTTKNANYDPSDGKVHYTVTVQSKGYNENVKVADSLTGTALTYDKNVKEQNSSVGSASDQTDRGFTYTIPEMTDGQTVTLTYTASVNFDALGGGTGTAKQVGNSVKTTSDQQKTTEEVQTNWNNKINYLSIAKSAGAAVEGTSGHQTIPWTVTYNANPKGSAAGRTITDSIADDSKDILSYSGEGITIVVKDASDKTIRTDKVEWKDIKQSDASWSYQIPKTDKAAYSYTVTYTTDADTSELVTDKTVNNTVSDDKSHSANASSNIQPGTDNKIGVKKEATAADNQKISWKVTLTVPKAGLKTAQVIDTLPTQYVDGQNRYDTWDDASVKVEGLLDGETMVKDAAKSDQTQAVYTFYQDKAHTKTGLKSAENARTITVTFDTKVNQDWLDKADQSYMMKHTNNVVFVGNGSKVTASADKEVVKQEIKKSMDQTQNVTVDGKTYPAWQYTITLKGAQAEDFDVTDTFDPKLRYVDPSNTNDQKLGLDLSSAGKLSDQWNNIAWDAQRLSADITDRQVVFHITKDDINNIKANKELHIRYWLIAKDPTALMKDAANNQDGKITLNNKATWAGNSAEANADYKYPGLSKKLLTDQSKLNTTDGSQPVATYELDANPAGAKIGDGDTVVVKDTMSANQVLNPQSVQMTPSEGTSYQVEKGDDGSQVITFTIPNETAVKIVYSATVTGTGGTLKNNAEMAGYKASSENSASKQTSSGGSASNYSLTVFKHKEGDLTTKLAGCTFELHKADETADEKFAGRGQTFTTGPDGSVEIKQPDGADWGLKAGTKYYLIETQAPAGYQLDQTKHYFTISADGTQDTSNNIYMNGATLSVGDKPTSTTLDKGALEIVKTTTGGTTPDGTTFTITGPDGYKVEKHYSDFKGGKLTIDNLPVGDYTVTENADSAKVDNYTLTVTGDNGTAKKVESNKTTTDTITNTYSQQVGKLEIVKTTTGGTTPADTTFTITGPNNYSNTVKYSEFKDGKLKIDKLPVGEYTVTENADSAKVNNYTLTVTGDNGKEETVAKDATKTVNITNTYNSRTTKGKLKLLKQSKNGKAIAGTTYTLYKWNGTDASQIGTVTRDQIEKANKDQWTSIENKATDEKGEYTTPELDAGTYAIMETKATAGYQRTANPAVFTVSDQGKINLIQKAEGAAEINSDGNMAWQETATNVEIAKVDENGKPVKGAILAVYDKDGKLIESWTTDGTAHRITAKLIAGDTYTLKELKAPEGYEKAADETFKVEEKDIVGIDQYVQDGINMTDKKTTTTTTTTNNNKTQTIAQGVKTGDPTTIGGLIAMIAAAGGIAVLSIKRLREAK